MSEFFDGLGLPFHVELVTVPSFLAISVLPQSIRDIAAQRLRTYAQGRCKPERRDHVLAVARQIETVKSKCTPEQLRTLMLFTNDLDFSRRQKVREVHGELLSLLQAEGFTWTDERSVASAA